MTLTLNNLIDVAEAAVGGSLDPRNDGTTIVNEAGNYFCDMHPWQFRTAPTQTMSLYAGQAWVDIPEGAVGVESIRATNALVRHVRVTTMDKINELRSALVTGTLDYWVAFEYPRADSEIEVPPHGRLALYPTPASDVADSFLITLQFGWRDLTDGYDVPNVSPRYHMLLKEIVRAVARGSTISVEGSLDHHLDLVENSAMMARLKQSDGRDAYDLGPMEGGIVREGGGGEYRPYETQTRA